MPDYNDETFRRASVQTVDVTDAPIEHGWTLPVAEFLSRVTLEPGPPAVAQPNQKHVEGEGQTKVFDPPITGPLPEGGITVEWDNWEDGDYRVTPVD